MKILKPLPSLLFSLLTWPLRVAAHRHAMNELGGLDDRELADIGLSRQDLRDATALPLAADPTRQLAKRAEERADAALRARGGAIEADEKTSSASMRIAAE